jgi:hypothetical protein
MSVKGAVQIALFLLGVGLLIGLIAHTDGEEMWQRISAAKPFFAAACAIYVAATMTSTLAWRALMRPDLRPGYVLLFAAQLCGESVNFVLPAGAPGEVAKGAVLKGRVDTSELAISLTIYNWLEGLVTAAVVMLSAAYALVAMDVPRFVPVVTVASGAILALITAGLRLALRRSAMRPLLHKLAKLPLLHFDAEQVADRMGELDTRIGALWKEDRMRLLRVLGYMSLARVFDILEVLVLLWGLLPERDLLWLTELAVLAQAASQMLQYAALALPGQIGAMEGGTASSFAMLGLGALLGLALELLRRGRKFVAVVVALAVWAALSSAIRATRHVPE